MSKIRSALFNIYNVNELSYGRFYPYLRWFTTPFKTIEQHIPKQGTIVDVGCGYGVLTNYLALTANERNVIGIDLNNKRIKLANKTIKGRGNIQFLAEDVTQVPFDKEFSAVVMTDFLHHLKFEDQDELLRSITKRVKKGGKLIIMEVGDKPVIKHWLSWIADVLLYPFSEKLNFRREREFESFLTELGYNVTRIPPAKTSLFAMMFYICEKRS